MKIFFNWIVEQIVKANNISPLLHTGGRVFAFVHQRADASNQLS